MINGLTWADSRVFIHKNHGLLQPAGMTLSVHCNILMKCLSMDWFQTGFAHRWHGFPVTCCHPIQVVGNQGRISAGWYLHLWHPHQGWSWRESSSAVSEDGVPPAIWVGKLVKHQILGYSTVPYLIGGFNPSEKYEFVSWDDDSQYIEK